MQSGVPSWSVSVSGCPQPQTPGAILAGSFGQPSMQSGVPSPSVSVSATPQPHAPGAILAGSFGQPSWQSGVPSPSVSVSGTPQPHAPGATFAGSLGQPSQGSIVPSPSPSVWHSSGTPFASQSWLVPFWMSRLSGIPLWLQSGGAAEEGTSACVVIVPPLLKSPRVNTPVAGAVFASKRKLYVVPQRTAFAL